MSYDDDALRRLVVVLERLATALEYKNECEYPREYMKRLFNKRLESGLSGS